MMRSISTTYRLIALTVALVFGLGAAGPGMCSSHGETPMPEAHDHSRDGCAAPCHIAKTPPQTIQSFQSTPDRRVTGFDGPVLFPASEQPATFHLRHHAPAVPQGFVGSSLYPVRLHLLHAVFLN